MSCSRLLDSSPPSRPLPSPAGPHGFYNTSSPQSPFYSFLGVSLWTLRHPRRYASRPFRFTLHSFSRPRGEGLAIRELNSPLFKIRSRGTSCFRTPDPGPADETTEAAPFEDWPPPHAASRLPTSWFLTTSPVQVPVPFGDCCTPAGQDSHRFRLKSRLSSTSSTPSTTRSVAGTNNERRFTEPRGSIHLAAYPFSRSPSLTPAPKNDGPVGLMDAAPLYSPPKRLVESIGFYALPPSPMRMHPSKNATLAQLHTHHCALHSPSSFSTAASERERSTQRGPTSRLSSEQETRLQTRVATSFPESFSSMGF